MTKIQQVAKPEVKSTRALPKEVQALAGKLAESTKEYRKSATTRHGTDSSFVAKTDLLGRASAQAERTTTNAKGDTSVVGRTADVFGIEKQTTQKTTTRQRGDTATTATRTTSKDSRGNQARTSDVTHITEQGTSVVTTNDKRARGTDLATYSSTTFEDGKFTLADGADWTKKTSLEKSFLKETEVDSAKFLAKADKFTSLFGKVFKALGLEGAWEKSLADDLLKTTTFFQGDHRSVTTQVGVSGSQRFSIDGDGLQAHFERDAKAGIYADASDEVTGKFGVASYVAHAQAEATAHFDAQGKIDANGLDASINARVGVSAAAELTGRAQTRSVTFLGTELNAGVEGHAKVSAVAKAEGEIKLSAGPFSVVGSAYASAGAEARATGVIGYEDGKFKMGGSAGAALGLGAGAGVTVEIDVRQLGEMARHAADVNGDGKLDLHDATAAVSKTAHKVARRFGF